MALAVPSRSLSGASREAERSFPLSGEGYFPKPPASRSFSGRNWRAGVKSGAGSRGRTGSLENNRNRRTRHEGPAILTKTSSQASSRASQPASQPWMKTYPPVEVLAYRGFSYCSSLLRGCKFCHGIAPSAYCLHVGLHCGGRA